MAVAAMFPQRGQRLPEAQVRFAGYLQGGVRGGQRAAGRLGAVDSPFGQFRGSGHHRVDDQRPEEPAEGRVSHEAAQVQRRGRIDELPHPGTDRRTRAGLNP